MQQKIKDILNHDGLNRGYIARKLYPNLELRPASAKLINKLNNTKGRKFTEQETAQVTEILKELGQTILANLSEATEAVNQVPEVGNKGAELPTQKTGRKIIDPRIFSTK